MKLAVDRVILLLAASGLDEATIYRTMREIERIGASRVTMEVEKIRHRLPAFAKHYTDELFGETSPKELERRRVIARVDEMLRHEAKLPISQAARMLSVSLMKSDRSIGPIPKFKSKQGFSDWLSRLSSTVSSAELLHHATKIRNEYVHKAGSDWPLKD